MIGYDRPLMFAFVLLVYLPFCFLCSSVLWKCTFRHAYVACGLAITDLAIVTCSSGIVATLKPQSLNFDIVQGFSTFSPII